MPTYQYHCRDCDADLEVVQKMTDPSLTVCPECSGALRKVFSAVGVVFKGSGFYATDSRSKSSSLAPGKESKSATSPASATTSASATEPASSVSASAPASSASAAGPASATAKSPVSAAA